MDLGKYERSHKTMEKGDSGLREASRQYMILA
jgi:hypothetical protein